MKTDAITLNRGLHQPGATSSYKPKGLDERVAAVAKELFPKVGAKEIDFMTLTGGSISVISLPQKAYAFAERIQGRAPSVYKGLGFTDSIGVVIGAGQVRNGYIDFHEGMRVDDVWRRTRGALSLARGVVQVAGSASSIPVNALELTKTISHTTKETVANLTTAIRGGGILSSAIGLITRAMDLWDNMSAMRALNKALKEGDGEAYLENLITLSVVEQEAVFEAVEKLDEDEIEVDDTAYIKLQTEARKGDVAAKAMIREADEKFPSSKKKRYLYVERLLQAGEKKLSQASAVLPGDLYTALVEGKEIEKGALDKLGTYLEKNIVSGMCSFFAAILGMAASIALIFVSGGMAEIAAKAISLVSSLIFLICDGVDLKDFLAAKNPSGHNRLIWFIVNLIIFASLIAATVLSGGTLPLVLGALSLIFTLAVAGVLWYKDRHNATKQPA